MLFTATDVSHDEINPWLFNQHHSLERKVWKAKRIGLK